MDIFGDQTINQDNLNWRVLSVNDDGTVDLISDKSTSQIIGLGEIEGYNNGVYLLNDIAEKLYSNSNLGGKARSLAIEDVEGAMNESGLNYVHTYTSNQGIQYGKTKTYTGATYYPNLYEQEKGSGIDTQTVKENGIGPSDSYYSSPTTDRYKQTSSYLTVTQTYYDRTMSSNYYKNNILYELIHSGDNYWLASRCINTPSTTNTMGFGLYLLENQSISGVSLFVPTVNGGIGVSYGINYCLRPVVSLNSSLKIGSGDGSSASTAYQIIQ